MKANHSPAKLQSGLSLIELMVAVLLSSLLLLGVTELYNNTFRTDRSGSALANLQDDARVAMEFIKRDIRRAGYLGCFDPQAGLSGLSFNYPEDAIREMGLSSITMSYASPSPLIGTIGTPSPLTISPTASGDSQWLVLTDCQTAVLFKGDRSGSTVKSTVPNEIRDLPPSTSYVHSFREVRYSLSNGQLMRAEQTSGSRTASAANLNTNNQAIIDGVTALSFEYGLTDSTGNITWYNASNPPPATPTAANFVDLSQIKVSMTLQGTTDTAISKTFTSVVQLRNRL